MSTGVEGSSKRVRKPIGPLRVFAALALYLLAGAGAVFSVSSFLSAQGIRSRRADGDFAGVALLESFIVVWILPMTLTAFIAAIGFLPPTRWLPRRADPVVPNPAERPSADRTLPFLYAAGLVLFGVAYLAFVRYVVGEPFPRGTLFWVIFFPSIALVLALLWAAWRLVRRQP
jgi:hypothetical protein